MKAPIASIVVLFLSFASFLSAKNVLIILGDDVGFEMGAYGNAVCKTPNIDALASRSLVFENAFTSVSSCSPSRSSMLTGLPHHQNGMYGLQNGYHHFQSFDGVRSLSNILNGHGIYTGIIGKKHVAPESVYTFNYSQTEMDHHSSNQVGRNITLIKSYIRQFLQQTKGRDFMLYVGLHDAHRCEHTHPELGVFCENFGDASIPGMGVIPDWKPVYYKPSEVKVPYFVPDTPAARNDLAAQYKTLSRFDQGVGMILQELEAAGHKNDTLVIFSSDNGIPFPNGRTNLYDSGIREPFMIYNPKTRTSQGKRSTDMVSMLDILPTVLDWFSIKYPKYSIFKHKPHVVLTGKSLLPLTEGRQSQTDEQNVFTSQSLHEITMYYPMRSVRTTKYKLIQNLAFRMPFPIDQDFYLSPTFQDILNKTIQHKELNWFKTLTSYYNRAPFELYDVSTDPHEVNNLFEDEAYRHIFKDLQYRLNSWQNITHDPWICSLGSVLEDTGKYAASPTCMPLYNGL